MSEFWNWYLAMWSQHDQPAPWWGIWWFVVAHLAFVVIGTIHLIAVRELTKEMDSETATMVWLSGVALLLVWIWPVVAAMYLIYMCGRYGWRVLLWLVRLPFSGMRSYFRTLRVANRMKDL